MLTSAMVPIFDAFSQKWTQGSRIELSLQSLKPTNFELITFPHLKKNQCLAPPWGVWWSIARGTNMNMIGRT